MLIHTVLKSRLKDIARETFRALMIVLTGATQCGDEVGQIRFLRESHESVQKEKQKKRSSQLQLGICMKCKLMRWPDTKSKKQRLGWEVLDCMYAMPEAEHVSCLSGLCLGIHCTCTLKSLGRCQSSKSADCHAKRS